MLKHVTGNKSLLTFAWNNLSAPGESWTSRSDEWAETARPNMSAFYIYTHCRVKLGAAPTASLEHLHNFIMNISEPLIEPAIIHSAHAPPSPSMHLKCRTTRPALSVTSNYFFKAEEACSGVCVCKWVCYCLLSKSAQLMTIWAWGEREEQQRRDGGQFEVVGGQDTRLIHPLSPQAHTGFFLFEKSLSLLLVFLSALMGFLRLPITSSCPGTEWTCS